MRVYTTPDEFFFRLHHVRPRFKSDLENVLFFMSEEITRIGELPRKEFVRELNNAIFQYPGNIVRSEKTINNWRTEISSLFGFIESTPESFKPSLRAQELSQRQDLVESFKIFLFNFQYPGAHIKAERVLEQIKVGIKFKPAQFLLKLLTHANSNSESEVGITKAEFCHCVFNDLRVTRDAEDVSVTWQRILDNRQNNVKYVSSSDVVRYAGDILDYMEIANLLKTYDGRTYYLNTLEQDAILKFSNSTEWFSGYDRFIDSRTATLAQINAITKDWFEYVNRDMSDTDLSTDILTYIAENEQELQLLRENITTAHVALELLGNITTSVQLPELAISIAGKRKHGVLRASIDNPNELLQFIKYVLTNYKVGTDISAVEFDEDTRYIDLIFTANSQPSSLDIIRKEKEFKERLESTNSLTTQDIGEIGEGLIFGHECMRIKLANKEELIKLVKRIPTKLGLGYDIQSVEVEDQRKRYIEVKTTISSRPINFNRIRLTKNEWSTASSTGERYFVYRLLLSKTEKKLFILQDPVGLYKQDLIQMIPSNGAEITFDPNRVGAYEELLTWEN